jgi:hypothetical protein
MKTRSLFLKALVSLFMIVAISSCSKDEDKNTFPNTLTGTVWRGVVEDEDETYSIELDFFSDDKVNRHFTGEEENVRFLYTYSKPNVLIYYDEGVIEGAVSGDKLTLYDGKFKQVLDRIK